MQWGGLEFMAEKNDVNEQMNEEYTRGKETGLKDIVYRMNIFSRFVFDI